MSDVSEMNKTKYVAALLATVLIFSIGIGLGYLFAQRSTGEFESMESDLQLKLLSLDLRNKLASEYICETNLFTLTKNKAELGSRLESLESQFGSDDPRIRNMKQRYSLLSVRQLLLVKKYNKQCEDDYIPIIFFYSNEKNVTANERQGYVLDYLYDKFEKRIAIYALSVDLDNQVLNTLKKVYDIDSTPSLVVNETTYRGLKNKKETLEILKNQTSLNVTTSG